MKEKEEEMSIPHLFRCPISLDLFTDPVTLSTGQTYDRPSIERWLAGGNLTCPVTMQRLHDISLVPNHTLRQLIDQWLLAGSQPTDFEAMPNSKLSSSSSSSSSSNNNNNNNNKNCQSLAALKHILESPDLITEAKLEISKKVRILSVESDTGQACLIQLGFFPLMLQLLLRAARVGGFELADVALDCILSLSPSTHLESLNVLRKEKNLGSFVALLDRGDVKIKTSICNLLETIASSVATQELCLIIGQNRRALQVLVSLVEYSDPRASEAAVRALSRVCSLEPNGRNAIKEGAVDAFLAYLSSSRRRNTSQALATLEMLMGLDIGKKAMAKNPNAVQILVNMVFRILPDIEGSEHAVGALLLLCCDSPRVRVEAAKAGLLKQLLLLLQSQCGDKAKAKARALLKLLRCMWAEDPGASNFYDAM